MSSPEYTFDEEQATPHPGATPEIAHNVMAMADVFETPTPAFDCRLEPDKIPIGG